MQKETETERERDTERDRERERTAQYRQVDTFQIRPGLKGIQLPIIYSLGNISAPSERRAIVRSASPGRCKAGSVIRAGGKEAAIFSWHNRQPRLPSVSSPPHPRVRVSSRPQRLPRFRTHAPRWGSSRASRSRARYIESGRAIQRTSGPGPRRRPDSRRRSLPGPKVSEGRRGGW